MAQEIEDFTSTFGNMVEALPPPPIQKTTQLTDLAKSITKEVGNPETSLLKEMEEEDKEAYTGIKTTLFRDPATGIKYKIPTVFSPNPIATRIMNYLDNTGFVHLLSIGSSGCLVAGSKVVLGDGSIVNIESFGNHNEQKINKEIRIDANTNSFATMFYRYDNQKTIEVITAVGYSIRGTYNHPLLINGKWVQLQHMKVGDILESITPDPIKYKIVKIIYHDKPVTVYDIEVPKDHRFITNGGIISHNSGKTTWSKSLVHRLHELGGFTPHWFMRDEIQKIDTIISGLEKGVNHIVVLDDASFSLEELPKEKINHLAKKLTYIRHEVKADVIVLMNIHYSKAIKKFFRAVPFTFLTSINMEEVNSFQDVFGSYARYKLRDFAWYFQQMMVKKQWTIELDKWAGKVQTYHTNKPFRLALANEINHLHFFVYSKNSCAVCDPDYQTKKIVDSEDFINKMDEKYNQQRMRAVLKTYALTRHGIPTWDTKRMAIWHTISDIDRSNRLDWKEIIGLLDKTSSNKRKRAYIKKGSIEKTVAELEESFKEREEDDLSTEGTLKDYKNQLEDDLAEMESKKIGDATLTEDDEKEFTNETPTPNESFGDDTSIDFGNDLNDSDGFNEDSDDN